MHLYIQSRLNASRYTATLAFATLMSFLGGQAANAYSNLSLNHVQARQCGAKLANINMSSLGASESYIGGGPHSDVDVGASVKLDIVEEELGQSLQAVRNCGATYIGGNWLVTAAHCVEDGNYIRIEVTAGASHIDAPQSVKRVAVDAICHAGYDSNTMRNDIALIRLKRPLPANIRPARLAAFTERNRMGIGEVTAWRRMRDGSIAQNARRAFLSLNGRQSTGMILAHPQPGAYESVCIGESGSGLFQSSGNGYEQIGVFSAVETSVAVNHVGPAEVQHCDKPNTRLIFTPVSEFGEWVRNVMNLCDSNSYACEMNPTRNPAPINQQVAGLPVSNDSFYDLQIPSNQNAIHTDLLQNWDGHVTQASPWAAQDSIIYTNAVPQYEDIYAANTYPYAQTAYQPVSVAYHDTPVYTDYVVEPSHVGLGFGEALDSSQDRPVTQAPSYQYADVQYSMPVPSNVAPVAWQENAFDAQPVAYYPISESVVYSSPSYAVPQYHDQTGHHVEYINLGSAPIHALAYEQIYQQGSVDAHYYTLPYIGASVTTQSWGETAGMK